MVLKTFNFQGSGAGQIVIDDNASNADIYEAMYLDATEENSNGRRVRILKEVENDDNKSVSK